MISTASANNLMGPVDSGRSLQAAVELTYVKAANDLLTNKLGNLQVALSATQQAIDVLTTLQNLHNEVAANSKGSFGSFFDFSSAYGGTTGYVNAYTKAASAFFNSAIAITAAFSTGGFAGFASQMIGVKQNLSAVILTLAGLTGNNNSDQNSLYSSLKAVQTDLNKTVFSTGTTVSEAGTMKWLLDNYNTANATGAASAGLIQQNITNAITAGQSLNTTQTESVRNYLYLFEEFYKSASTILQAITQIITKMADGISR